MLRNLTLLLDFWVIYKLNLESHSSCSCEQNSPNYIFLKPDLYKETDSIYQTIDIQYTFYNIFQFQYIAIQNSTSKFIKSLTNRQSFV